jgi:hypothetical protein
LKVKITQITHRDNDNAFEKKMMTMVP